MPNPITGLQAPAARMERADIQADLSHVAERFRLCANILEGQAGAAAMEQRAAAWMIVEEMHRLMPRLWRCVR